MSNNLQNLHSSSIIGINDTRTSSSRIKIVVHPQIQSITLPGSQTGLQQNELPLTARSKQYLHAH